MNEATFGKLIAVVGVRFDYFKDIDEGPGLSFNDENVTFRAGLVYRLREDVSVFAQWAESYEPQSLSQQDVNAGGPFSPTEGEMFEGGIRTELFDGRIQANLTAYHIKRANILQADPRGDVDDDGTDDFVAFGEVTSEGVEFDLVTDITRDWLLTLSYAYNDARLTQDNGLTAIDFNVGDRFPNAPKHQLGFWSRYQVADTGLALAGGGDYVSRRVSMSGQTVRPYVVFDASIIYEFGDWSALLRVDNVFDKTYAASGFIDRTGHFPGEPRSFFVELTRRW